VASLISVTSALSGGKNNRRVAQLRSGGGSARRCGVKRENKPAGVSCNQLSAVENNLWKRIGGGSWLARSHENHENGSSKMKIANHAALHAVSLLSSISRLQRRLKYQQLARRNSPHAGERNERKKSASSRKAGKAKWLWRRKRYQSGRKHKHRSAKEMAGEEMRRGYRQQPGRIS
jgi:hypothetical protein